MAFSLPHSPRVDARIAPPDRSLDEKTCSAIAECFQTAFCDRLIALSLTICWIPPRPMDTTPRSTGLFGISGVFRKRRSFPSRALISWPPITP